MKDTKVTEMLKRGSKNMTYICCEVSYTCVSMYLYIREWCLETLTIPWTCIRDSRTFMKNVSHNVNTLKCRDKELGKGGRRSKSAPLQSKKKAQTTAGQKQDAWGASERKTISKDGVTGTGRSTEEKSSKAPMYKNRNNKKNPRKTKTLTNDYLALAGALKRKLRHKS